jgi:hypothetical protein
VVRCPRQGRGSRALNTFTPQPGGVLVTTGESWSGEPVENAVAELQAARMTCSRAWLGFLAEAAGRMGGVVPAT